MREIKFRAWHKPTNQFVRCHPAWNDNLRQYKDLGLLSLTSDGELIFETMYDGFQRLSSSNEVDDFIVQQYTGLKDKNEVEIYEGDIVEFCISEDGPETATVTFENAVFWAAYPLYEVVEKRFFCKVIGNIFLEHTRKGLTNE